MVVVLTGGTGGAKLVQGVVAAAPAHDVVAIVNTADDLQWWGLHVSPDIDSVVYALAGVSSRERGWGLDGETFRCLEAMRRLGGPHWFQLGDMDLATHLRRTQLLAEGQALSRATADIAAALGVTATILPMTDAAVRTRVATGRGELAFQEYFVRERCQVAPTGVHYAGADLARPAPGVTESILSADVVLLAPSNPVTSIGPILAVPGIRDALRATPAPVVAVSPIIGNAPVSGPAGDLMRAVGLPVSAQGVAAAYQDFLDVIVADLRGGPLADPLPKGVRVAYTDTMMVSDEAKAALAAFALGAAGRA